MPAIPSRAHQNPRRAMNVSNLAVKQPWRVRGPYEIIMATQSKQFPFPRQSNASWNCTSRRGTVVIPAQRPERLGTGLWQKAKRMGPSRMETTRAKSGFASKLVPICPKQKPMGDSLVERRLLWEEGKASWDSVSRQSRHGTRPYPPWGWVRPSVCPLSFG